MVTRLIFPPLIVFVYANGLVEHSEGDDNPGFMFFFFFFHFHLQ